MFREKLDFNIMATKMMISCESATLFVSKKEEHKLSLRERFQLLIHLAVCKFCRLFEKQNRFLLHQLKHASTSVSLSESEKETLQIKINSELKK